MRSWVLPMDIGIPQFRCIDFRSFCKFHIRMVDVVWFALLPFIYFAKDPFFNLWDSTRGYFQTCWLPQRIFTSHPNVQCIITPKVTINHASNRSTWGLVQLPTQAPVVRTANNRTPNHHVHEVQLGRSKIGGPNLQRKTISFRWLTVPYHQPWLTVL